jgi:hypothetical protein
VGLETVWGGNPVRLTSGNYNTPGRGRKFGDRLIEAAAWIEYNLAVDSKGIE